MLDAKIADLLRPVARHGYITAHDAYQYAEKAYGLNGLGVVAVSPDRPAGAASLAALRQAIETKGAVCLFAETQFSPPLAKMLADEFGLRTAEINPLGTDTDLAVGGYGTMMNTLATTIARCLSGSWWGVMAPCVLPKAYGKNYRGRSWVVKKRKHVGLRDREGDRVDVLMPVYNAAPYIEQAIGSIVSQTHENWRLLIQDDGSTDDSLSLARACASRDSRIEILPPFATNRGVGAAANALLGAVRGDFVTWQDADDYSDPRRLAMQVDFLNSHPAFGAVGTGVQIVSVTGHPLIQETYPQDPCVHKKDPSLCCSSVMSRRDAAAFAGLFLYDYGGRSRW